MIAKTVLLAFAFSALISETFALAPRSNFKFAKSRSTKRFLSPTDAMDSFHQVESYLNSISSHSILTSADEVAAEAVSVYSKVDKTGFIGFFANIIEQGIDLGHTALQAVGVKYSYGFSIIFFTFIVKILTLPLTTTQLESTTKMQKLQPLQQKIQAKYANDEQTKNQMLSQLFQAANVNPLAGCLPALVQIPIFISLYRALQNLVAENKLDEPFLWIPDLEGPVYTNPPGTSMDWIKTAFTGTPTLGWEDTIAFATLPLILFISQTASMKILQPPKDPKKVLTEQEEISQGIVNNLPFIVAFFSLNVPAGLSVYWIVNNIMTTLVTVSVKNRFKDDPMPVEVERMMAAIDGTMTAAKPRAAASAMKEFKQGTVKDERKAEGFGFGSAAIKVEPEVTGAGSVSNGAPAANVDDSDDNDDEDGGDAKATDGATDDGSRRRKGKGRKDKKRKD